MAPQYAKDQSAGSKNRIEKIAFVGAGGQSGKYIVEELLKNPQFEITAITRPSSSSSIPNGVHHISKVDYDDEASVVEALKGHDILVITMAVQAGPEAQDKLIKAAAKAGIPLVVPNEFGYDGSNQELSTATLVGIPKTKSRAEIEAAGMSWIGIACGFWYEFSLSSGPGGYGFDLGNRKLTLFDGGDVKISTSTFPQVGRAVAAVLALPLLPKDEHDKSLTVESFRNKFVHFDSFTLTQKDMLAAVQKVTNTTDKDWTTTTVPVKEYYAEALKELQAGNRPAFRRVLYGRMFFPEESGNMEKQYGLDNEKLGLPKEDLLEFTKIAVKMAEEGYIEKVYGKQE